ncbi:hypothetical protein [Amphritea sp.]|uniref:hypothetical protein n=1 Tax=Amphritea sp. TaxID=1872502 RepID=UPI0025BA2B0F|nr:hypothetical protein [Amphritea sp.]
MEWVLWGIVILAVIGFIGKAQKNKDSKPEVSNGLSQEKLSQDAVKIEVSNYQAAIVDLAALLMVSDGVVEEAEIEMVFELIEHDDYLYDKALCAENLMFKIEELQSEHKKSPVAFKLKAVSIMQAASSLKSLVEQDRVLVFLESLLDSIKEGDRNKAELIYEKIKKKVESVATISSSEAAEMYIMKSGNAEAIAEFSRMKAHPKHYSRNFKKAAKSNSVMKTALGVFTGVIAASLVMGAINQVQLDQALASFDQDLESMGGIDAIDVSEEAMPLEGVAGIGANNESLAMGSMEGVDTSAVEELDAGGIFDDLDIFG